MADTRRTLAALQALLADNTTGDISAQDARDVLVSDHPTNVVQTGTEAATPSSGQLIGDLYLPSNGVYQKRWSGSAWVPWGPLFPMTAPIDGDFAWVNQGGASVSTTNGGVYLEAPISASKNFRIRVKTAPATPYTITTAFLPAQLGVLAQFTGLCFRQTSDGKLMGFYIISTTTNVTLSVTSLDSPTVGNTNLRQIEWPPRSLVWLRIADDGTNRKYSYSADGQHFVEVYSELRTTFLTADQVGFLVNDETNVYTVGMMLLSWAQG